MAEPITLFISPYTDAPDTLTRALNAFGTQFPLATFPTAASVYIQAFGDSIDYLAAAAFREAGQHTRQRLLFVREGLRQETAFLDLLAEAPEVKPLVYTSPYDLCTLVLRSLLRVQAAAVAGWRIPPLPPRSPLFAGRGAEIELIDDLLTQYPSVLLTGLGGIGKSALALELAYRVRDNYPGGVFWLAGSDTPEQHWRSLGLAHPLARALLGEARPFTQAELQQWLGEMPGRALVILDDVQQGEQLQHLRAVLPPESRLLATSRPANLYEGWRSYHLEGLSVRDGSAMLRQVLSIPANLSQEMMQPIQQIVEGLQGHPLSLTLVAAWLQRMGGWRAALLYLQRLQETENLFSELSPSLASPAYVEKAFSMIYRTLSPAQKQVLRTMGIFAPGCVSLEALRTLSDTLQVRHLFDSPMEVLIQWDELRGGYTMPSLFRDFAAVLLHSEGSAAPLQARHLAYYLDQAAQKINRHLSSSDPELPQYRQAFAWALTESTEHLLPFVLTAGQWLFEQHQYEMLGEWLQKTLDALPQQGDSQEHAGMLRGLGDLSLRLNDGLLARQFYDRALLLYYQTKSLSGQANTLKAMGDLAAKEQQVQIAQDYYDRTLQLYAQIDFQLGRANTLRALGDLSVQGDDLSAARDYYLRTLDLYEQINFQLGCASTLKALGDLHMRAREWLAAQEFYQQALESYHDISFFAQEAETLIALGELYLQLNDLAQAMQAFDDALRLYRSVQDPHGEASTLKRLARLYMEQNRLDDAANLYQQALTLYRELHLSGEEAKTCQQLGLLRGRQGQAAAAVGLLLHALRLFHTLNLPRHNEEVRTHLRDLARRLGEARFAAAWAQASPNAPLPDWLKHLGTLSIPQELSYAIRDLLLADDWDSAQYILESHRGLMLSEAADDVFAQMLQQYAGQPGPTRQIERYRSLLRRCREVGIDEAVQEIRAPAGNHDSNRADRLYHSLDSYAAALERLRDIPLVYASVQLNRASLLREIASLPEQDREQSLRLALEAYNAALERQHGAAPLDYAQTQIQKANTLLELSELPGQDRARLLYQMLAAYDEALQHQQNLPLDYAQTQLKRAQTLLQVGHLPGEKLRERMYEALSAYQQALERQKSVPLDYAKTQRQQAELLYEMAGLPGEDFNARMLESLTAYDEALEYLREDSPLDYAKTQRGRVALLRDMAGLPGQDRAARLYQALAAANEVLRYLQDSPEDYAQTQINRAHLLRELAGLAGEHRLARMREALATYNEVLETLRHNPVDYVATQNSRAALLRELASLPGENRLNRLRQAMEAIADALSVAATLEQAQQLQHARRMMNSTRQEIIKADSAATFARWWAQIMNSPLPDWVG